MKVRIFLARVSLVVLVASTIAACSTKQVPTAAELFSTANEAMDNEVYELAIDEYRRLLEEHPFSEYTEEAQLKVAHAQYLNGRYPEAIASFEDFQRMHPTNPNLPFAEYHIALSYMDQMGKRARDRKAAENAHYHFQSVIDRYPDSPYAVEAAQKRRECREVLASNELYIAEFYLSWDNPTGAEARLKQLLQTYPDTEVAAQGLATFGEHFRGRGDLPRAAMAYASLLEHYPQSPRMADARQALYALEERSVEAPDEPLLALLETLGRSTAPADRTAADGRAAPDGDSAVDRPFVPLDEPTEDGDETAGHVDTPGPIR